MRYVYPCNITPDAEEGEGFIVRFPDVPAAITGDTTFEESLFLAEDALLAALSIYVYQQKDVPIPSTATDGQELVAVPPIAAAKLALYTAMREQDISTLELGEQLELNEAAVAKLIDPDRYSHITQVMKALKAVGRSIVIEDREISAPQRQEAHPVIA